MRREGMNQDAAAGLCELVEPLCVASLVTRGLSSNTCLSFCPAVDAPEVPIRSQNHSAASRKTVFPAIRGRVGRASHNVSSNITHFICINMLSMRFSPRTFLHQSQARYRDFSFLSLVVVPSLDLFFLWPQDSMQDQPGGEYGAVVP